MLKDQSTQHFIYSSCGGQMDSCLFQENYREKKRKFSSRIWTRIVDSIFYKRYTMHTCLCMKYSTKVNKQYAIKHDCFFLGNQPLLSDFI